MRGQVENRIGSEQRTPKTGPARAGFVAGVVVVVASRIITAFASGSCAQDEPWGCFGRALIGFVVVTPLAVAVAGLLMRWLRVRRPFSVSVAALFTTYVMLPAFDSLSLSGVAGLSVAAAACAALWAWLLVSTRPLWVWIAATALLAAPLVMSRVRESKQTQSIAASQIRHTGVHAPQVVQLPGWTYAGWIPHRNRIATLYDLAQGRGRVSVTTENAVVNFAPDRDCLNAIQGLYDNLPSAPSCERIDANLWVVRQAQFPRLDYLVHRAGSAVLISSLPPMDSLSTTEARQVSHHLRSTSPDGLALLGP